MSLLGFTRARRIEPDPVPASDLPDLTVQIEVTLPPAFQPNPDCICRGDRQNPTCDEHPWCDTTLTHSTSPTSHGSWDRH